MMNITYQSIPMPPVDNDNIDTVIETRHSRLLWSKIGLIVLGVVSVVAILGRYSSSPEVAEVLRGSSDVNTASLLGSAKKNSATACTFEECYASSCNAKVAPYTCLFHNGGPHGGCSPVPWTPETCTQQCDLSGCSSLKISKDVPSCEKECDKEWCDMAAGRLCGKDVQYQCSMGSSAFGCSADKYQWTIITASTSCSSCCNSNTC